MWTKNLLSEDLAWVVGIIIVQEGDTKCVFVIKMKCFGSNAHVTMALHQRLRSYVTNTLMSHTVSVEQKDEWLMEKLKLIEIYRYTANDISNWINLNIQNVSMKNEIFFKDLSLISKQTKTNQPHSKHHLYNFPIQPFPLWFLFRSTDDNAI